jgi:hypothetical protein
VSEEGETKKKRRRKEEEKRKKKGVEPPPNHTGPHCHRLMIADCAGCVCF